MKMAKRLTDEIVICEMCKEKTVHRKMHFHRSVLSESSSANFLLICDTCAEDKNFEDKLTVLFLIKSL